MDSINPFESPIKKADISKVEKFFDNARSKIDEESKRLDAGKILFLMLKRPKRLVLNDPVIKPAETMEKK